MSLKKLLTLAMVSVSLTTYAQNVGVNSDASTPDASAMLDVKSTNKGVLIPRMTLVERAGITMPATGLLIYQTDNTPGFYYNSGTPGSPVWTMISGSSATQGTVNGLYIGQGTGNPSVFTPASTAANQFLSTPTSGGVPTWTTPSDVTGSAVVTVSNGAGQGVGVGNTNIDVVGANGGVMYGTGTSSAFTPAGTSGYILRSTGAGAPVWAAPNTTLTTSNVTGTGVVAVSNGAGQTVGSGNVSVDVVGGNGGVLYGTGTSSAFTPPSTGNNQVLATPTMGGNPAWVNANSTLTTSNITPATSSSVVVSNGTNKILCSTPVTVDVQGTMGGVMYGTGVTPATFTAAGNAGDYLKSNGAGAPTWSIPKARFSVPSNNFSGSTAINTGLGTAYGGPVTLTNVTSPVGLTTYLGLLGTFYQASANVDVLGTSGWIYTTTISTTNSFTVYLYQVPGLTAGGCNAGISSTATIASANLLGSCIVNTFSSGNYAGKWSIDLSSSPVALTAGDALMLIIVNNSGAGRIWYGIGTADFRANVN